MCDKLLSNFHDQICKSKNVAVVYSEDQYMEDRIKCPIYEFSGLFSNAYVSFKVSRGIKSKKMLNQAFLKMQEIGIIDSMSKR